MIRTALPSTVFICWAALATPAAAEPEHDSCLAALVEARTEAESVAPISEGECRAEGSLRVSRIAGSVALDPPGIMSCPVALALTRWVREDVAALGAPRFKAKLTALRGTNGYECRRRNRAETGPISEHAFANAVDVHAFVFGDGRVIVAVGTEANVSGEAAAFLSAARATACRHFTTVIGPDQPAHDDHFHFDLKQRRSGFRLCQ